MALNLLGQPILSPSPRGLIQGPFGTVNCLLPKESMRGLAALKSGHKLQSKCCQFSQLPCGQSQEPSEDSTLTPSGCLTSVHGGLSAPDGRHLPQRTLTCTITGAWADFLRSCPHRADGCSLLCLGLTQGWQVLGTRALEALPPTDILVNFSASTLPAELPNTPL